MARQRMSMAKIDISREVIGAALTIHRKLGPGLLESAYEACLAYELEKAGYRVNGKKRFRSSMRR